MADFTTWAAYLTALKNDLNNRGYLTKSYRTPDGTFVEYRTIEEMFDAIARAEDRVESGDATSGVASRRSHAIARSGA